MGKIMVSIWVTVEVNLNNRSLQLQNKPLKIFELANPQIFPIHNFSGIMEIRYHHYLKSKVHIPKKTDKISKKIPKANETKMEKFRI